MGTWSATIFGNDTSEDVKDEFYQKYNNDEKIEKIIVDILQEYSESLDDMNEDKTNIFFALAYCLWEVNGLSESFLNDIDTLIKSDEDTKILKSLDAENSFLKSREKAIIKFWDKINTPCKTPKKRVKPPVEIESIYRNGACLAFQYPNNLWGCLIISEGRCYDKLTAVNFLQTNLKCEQFPTFDDVLNSHIIDESFHKHDPSRQASFYYSFTNCDFQYLQARETKKFHSYNDQFFTIIDYLPVWIISTTGSRGGISYHFTTYEEFKESSSEILSKHFTREDITKMTVREINDEFISRQNKL